MTTLPILTSADGVVSVVSHASMPGVLIRVATTATWMQSVRIVRSVEGQPWAPVLSGDPVRLMRGGGVRSGHAFDLAAVVHNGFPGVLLRVLGGDWAGVRPGNRFPIS